MAASRKQAGEGFSEAPQTDKNAGSVNGNIVHGTCVLFSRAAQHPRSSPRLPPPPRQKKKHDPSIVLFPVYCGGSSIR